MSKHNTGDGYKLLRSLGIILVCILWTAIGYGNDNKIFTILSSNQKLKFSIDDGKLIAKLEVEEVIKCNTKTGELFRKFIS
jgi:hypothetical protein